MDGSFARYCTAVCDQVRFRPDRAAIQSELWGHLEDHAAALEGEGLSREEAKARAVEAMGDPVEVGKALDALHSPLAGWLLLALTWCAKACGVAALILLFLSCRRLFLHVTGPLRSMEVWTSAHAEWPAGPVYHPTAIHRGKDYTYSVEGARLVEEEDFWSIYYLLRVEHKNPWLRDPNLKEIIRAEDDLGNSYPSIREQAQMISLLVDEEWAGSSTGNSMSDISSPFVTYYDMWVSPIDPSATEITLICDYYGPWEFTLTIPLEGGALS